MPLKKISLDGIWKLKDAKYSRNDNRKYSNKNCDSSKWINVNVPGDIHPALQEAGKIPEPFLDINTEKCKWTSYRDWWFRKEIKIPHSFGSDRIQIVLNGIDTYATLYVNGSKIGETSNMFYRYCFDITDKILLGQINSVSICIHATKEVIESRDTSSYIACFYTPRIFARKAQCQFSWDWAPHLPSLGIHRNVWLQSVKPGVIENVFVRSRMNGKVHMLVELDEEIRKHNIDNINMSIKISHGINSIERNIDVKGIKNIINFKVSNPKLWWPKGYGEPNLYKYEIKLLNKEQVLDVQTGAFGIREVELIQDPNGGDTQHFLFKVNGKEVFCLGANWVPADCFPGTISVEKYEHLIRLTKLANFNMLRVWGGGLYEEDVFYELCDQNGIMVWQDMMFACSDIPDSDPEFTMSLVPEFEYQVKRLRNHPCITHWCGGNEKTGAFGKGIKNGDFVTHYLARGVIQDLCPDIAYTPSSPISITDVSNDPGSGDTHGGTYEESYCDDIVNFRQHIDNKRAAFMSEFGLHGPAQMRSLKKFISEEKLWPLNEVWEHHVSDNPYNDLPETFVQVQHNCSSALFYPPKSAVDFVKVAGTFHAEYLYAEFQHHRRMKPANSGALIWMLNDCWPCANWSIIDYYGLPKQVYYYLKRACEPIVLSFRKVKGGYDLYLTHNLNKELNGTFKVQLETMNGSVKKLQQQNFKIKPHFSKVIAHITSESIGKQKDSYLFANLKYNKREINEIYFHNLWKDISWPSPKLSVNKNKLVKKNGMYETTINLKTDSFARCVNLSTHEDIYAYFSDNFFDMRKGEVKKVIVSSLKKFNPNKIKINHWLTDWE